MCGRKRPTDDNSKLVGVINIFMMDVQVVSSVLTMNTRADIDRPQIVSTAVIVWLVKNDATAAQGTNIP